jgi:hypothetical protein
MTGWGEANAMSLTSKKRLVFLSHSGRDAGRATEIAATLEQRLAERGLQVEVFNTSEPEHRYEDLRELLLAGQDWRARAEQYDDELRRYLIQNMKESAAFLSLVTPNSLEAASRVIEFELQTARSMAIGKETPFFFPCVADGASLGHLPPAAMEFEGVDLDAEEGLTRLVEEVHRALSEHVDA